MARVVLAMSGGVDSSVAAWLLREQGHDVVGLFMRSGVQAEEPAACSSPQLPVVSAHHSRREGKQGCCSAQDAADAQRVADRLDIPFYALDFHDAFGRIMDYFADEYLAGRTPNPCAVCNQWLKFGKLWSYAQQIGADFIATGHYAQRETSTSGCRLLRAVDADKDQSYVLFGLARELLPHVHFPVGRYPKEEIRRMARGLEMRVAEKPDSQEICFVARGHYADFVRQRRPGSETAGPIVDVVGQVLGRHEGIENFTVGQRRGVGLAMGEPYYVVAVEREGNRVVIGPRAALGRREMEVNEVHWLSDRPSEPMRCTVKIRYRHHAAAAVVTPIDTARGRVEFDEPQFGVAPGQAAVFYEEDRVLGGGWIC